MPHSARSSPLQPDPSVQDPMAKADRARFLHAYFAYALAGKLDARQRGERASEAGLCAPAARRPHDRCPSGLVCAGSWAGGASKSVNVYIDIDSVWCARCFLSQYSERRAVRPSLIPYLAGVSVSMSQRRLCRRTPRASPAPAVTDSRTAARAGSSPMPLAPGEVGC